MNALSALAPRRFVRLLVADAMNVSRDPMLVIAMVMSVLPALGFWLFQEQMDEAAAAAFGLVAVSRYVVPVALLVPALLIGWVTGFLLLEDRDDGPLLALDVTPVGKVGFFAYRVSVTALVTAAITFAAIRLMLPEAGWGLGLLLTGLVAANAVAVAAILPAVARNKVEGLALTKVVNIASVVPLLAVIPSPWRYLGGIVPSFWIGELLGLSGQRLLWEPLVAALALGTHLALLAGLFVLLARRTG